MMRRKLCFTSAHHALVRVETANTFTKRLVGLMFRSSMESGSGLLLTDCGSIHTCCMRFAIDVVYLSKDYRVISIQRALPPWRVGRLVKGARHVLEMPQNEADFAVGDQIVRPSVPLHETR